MRLYVAIVLSIGSSAAAFPISRIHRGRRIASPSDPAILPEERARCAAAAPGAARLGSLATASALRSTARAVLDNDDDDDDGEENATPPEQSADAGGPGSDLTEEDWSVVRMVREGIGFPDSAPLEDRVASAMGGMHPRLMSALRSAAAEGGGGGGDEDESSMLREVGGAMATLLDGRLSEGREMD